MITMFLYKIINSLYDRCNHITYSILISPDNKKSWFITNTIIKW